MLSQIRDKLKANKNQFNNFGKYKYRSCEDILEAIKPLLGECSLTITDDIVLIGDRFYVKATCSFQEPGKDLLLVSAYARESESKKGMDGSQVTGSSSSYARKYALSGLFLIDDNKDPDSHCYTETPKQQSTKPAQKPKLLTKKQKETIIDLCHQGGWDAEGSVKAVTGTTLDQLTPQIAMDVISRIKAKIASQEK